MHAGVPSQAQLTLDLSGLPQRALLRVDEVASYLTYSRHVIYDMVVAGELEAHRRGGDRSVMLITRRSVEAFLLSSATLEPADFMDRIKSVTRRLSPAQRQQLAAHLLSH